MFACAFGFENRVLIVMGLFNRAFVHGDVRDVMEMARTVLQAHATVDWCATMLESLLAFCFPSTVTVTLVNGVVRSSFVSLSLLQPIAHLFIGQRTAWDLSRVDASINIDTRLSSSDGQSVTCRGSNCPDDQAYSWPEDYAADRNSPLGQTFTHTFCP